MVHTTRPRRVRTGFVTASVVVSAWFAIVAASAPAPIPVRTFPAGAGNEVGDHGVLTSDLGDRYTASSSQGSFRGAALESNRSSNLRMVFWPRTVGQAADQQSCATLRTESDWSDQEGAALRISRDDSGSLHAITVSKNIFFGATWIFNVHEWNSNATPALRALGALDLSSVLRAANGDPVRLPWRLCARVVGALVEVKVWPLSHPDPGWRDRRYGGQVKLDDAASARGFPGWYLGHLRPGDTVDLTSLGLWGLDSDWAGSSLPRAHSVVAGDQTASNARPGVTASIRITRRPSR